MYIRYWRVNKQGWEDVEGQDFDLSFRNKLMTSIYQNFRTPSLKFF